MRLVLSSDRVAADGAAARVLAGELPEVTLAAHGDGVLVDLDALARPGAPPWPLEAAIAAAASAGPPALIVRSPRRPPAAAALAVATRWQRLLPAPTGGDGRLARLVEAHQALHDLGRPLVRADLDHAR